MRRCSMARSDKDSLQKLIEQKQKIEERIKTQQALLQKKERQEDTRKKILVGALFLEEYKDKMDELTKKMDKFLKRDSDRELFGLTPITTNQASEKE
jgi:large subunit ribosomal protein L7/L12